MIMRSSTLLTFGLVLVIGLLTAQEEAKKAAFVKITPEKATLQPGQQLQFTAKGYTSDDEEVAFTAEWEATGGEVTQAGLFTAGTKSGVHSVMATCKQTGAQGTAVVIIKADDMEGYTIKTPDKNPYFHITALQVKPENDAICQFLIKVAIDSDEVTMIKLRMFAQGVPQGKDLLQQAVKGKAQIAQFKGKFIKKTTVALGIAVYGGDKELFLLKLGVAKLMAPKLAIPGGYMAQDPDSADMQKMAKQAADLLTVEHPDHHLLKVHEAATQVVAGVNYFFILEFETPETGNIKLQVIMYEDFKGNCSITNKEEVE